MHSIMKMEHLIYLRTNVNRLRHAGSLPILTKRNSNASTGSKRELCEIFDGKSEAKGQEVGTTSYAMHDRSEAGRRERESLEEYLGPMFIRVQHEVQWSVDRS